MHSVSPVFSTVLSLDYRYDLFSKQDVTVDFLHSWWPAKACMLVSCAPHFLPLGCWGLLLLDYRSVPVSSVSSLDCAVVSRAGWHMVAIGWWLWGVRLWIACSWIVAWGLGLYPGTVCYFGPIGPSWKSVPATVAFRSSRRDVLIADSTIRVRDLRCGAQSPNLWKTGQILRRWTVVHYQNEDCLASIACKVVLKGILQPQNKCCLDASLEINLGNLPVIVTGKTWNLPVTEDFYRSYFLFICCLLTFKCNVHLCCRYRLVHFLNYSTTWQFSRKYFISLARKRRTKNKNKIPFICHV